MDRIRDKLKVVSNSGNRTKVLNGKKLKIPIEFATIIF